MYRLWPKDVSQVNLKRRYFVKRRTMDSSDQPNPFPMEPLLSNSSKAVPAPPGGIFPNGAGWLDTDSPVLNHAFDIRLCIALEELFKGKDVVDLGAGLGYYGRCLLHLKEPLFMHSPDAEELFYKLAKVPVIYILTFSNFCVVYIEV